MTPKRITTAAVAGAALLLAPLEAGAQVTRTFVSGVGNDADPCSRTAPCRTFAGALGKTFENGEINVLDPGGYGSVTITKGVTINGQGPIASILASATTGIIINCAGLNANDAVIIKNISINGAGATGPEGPPNGTGIDGIRILSGGPVHIENVDISRFTQEAIEIARTNSTGFVTVKDVQIRQCTNAGIKINTTGAGNAVHCVFEDVDIRNCGDGILAQNGARFSIRDSALNSNITCVNINGPTLPAKGVIHGCLLSNSTTGLSVSNPGNVGRLLSSQIIQTATPTVELLSGVVETDNLNRLIGNSNPPAIADPVGSY